MLHNSLINKGNFDAIFNNLASTYEHLGGNENINIYLVGGTAIVLNFFYRQSTLDVDALFNTNNIFKEAIKIVGNDFKLANNWLNSDFVNTPSYSNEIIKKATLYNKYGKNINVYCLETKYLLAMKIKSSRPEGGDIDDIIKMIYETRLNNKKLTYNEVIDAYKELYNDFTNTYESTLYRAKEAFEVPLEDIECIIYPNRSLL